MVLPDEIEVDIVERPGAAAAILEDAGLENAEQEAERVVEGPVSAWFVGLRGMFRGRLTLEPLSPLGGGSKPVCWPALAAGRAMTEG